MVPVELRRRVVDGGEVGFIELGDSAVTFLAVLLRRRRRYGASSLTGYGAGRRAMDGVELGDQRR